ncbi:polyisoprenoid diphosphate/phosphate phosphohydrolase PLPP6 isoform X2 [Calliopsis andreniformis]|uniref:polyisoprenoid diphosphate/phosphate phosphohydrolase PLPP6 isoform X2 n=1 Tax=Calliopsis andreniformis TaxID=337506 RepID=UPI003FCEE63C
MDEENKREVPSLLKKILAVDAQLTENFIRFTENLMPVMKQLKIHYVALEISCHAIPWIASILASIWIFNSQSLYQIQVNLLLGLLLDIIIVAFLKALTRRRRPVCTDDPFAVGPDKYSFPSGHSSRSVLVFYFLQYLWPVSSFFFLPLLAWVVATSLSRVLMRRHYILDVLAGLVLGYAEAILMSILYLEADTCLSLVSWLTDEKLDGAEYDV